jgi:hypothetical protein
MLKTSIHFRDFVSGEFATACDRLIICRPRPDSDLRRRSGVQVLHGIGDSNLIATLSGDEFTTDSNSML